METPSLLMAAMVGDPKTTAHSSHSRIGWDVHIA
jgi:hypothetical protein